MYANEMQGSVSGVGVVLVRGRWRWPVAAAQQCRPGGLTGLITAALSLINSTTLPIDLSQVIIALRWCGCTVMMTCHKGCLFFL